MEWIEDVKRARSGDPDAFVRLMRAFEAVLYQTARAFLHSDEDCADAMQETVLRAYRSIKGLKEPAYFKTWLVRIHINECKRMLQSRKSYVPLTEETDPRVNEAGFVVMELQELVDRLEAPLRTIARLYYYGDLSVKEIAEQLRLPEGTVKSRLHRARGILASLSGEGREKGVGCS
ncbi:RNA polymerase subunit sigma-24 [Cohnella xylanilytica]|uniref:RNA polymerase sigma factor n=1 Tax=Cohnella xylanilytica TaxID=557555 RepID=UPI001B19A4EF|nr:sigma-70 family RNA polymerase sigma factor [Cohnella xylanilytica]GIO14017.1 RNA polymerase subunit sigma-24 [Cohnella xylanilytica]